MATDGFGEREAYFKQVDQLLASFFPNTSDEMKTAILFITVDDKTYKSVLDGYVQQAIQPTYAQLVKRPAGDTA